MQHNESDKQRERDITHTPNKGTSKQYAKDTNQEIISHEEKLTLH